jgi:hypothetical protein
MPYEHRLTGLSFAVDPDETGDYYIQYKPETLDAARGIWQYAVE